MPTCNEPDLNLLVHYFNIKNKNVIGRQHGGCYVTQKMKEVHYDSDYNNCKYFLTYGFDNNDFNKAYGVNKPPCEIVPVGRKLITQKINPKYIDILYPIIPTADYRRLNGRNEWFIYNTQSVIINELQRKKRYTG